MKNNKGFTLVELLAAAVVLVILLLIAIPTITRLTEETKKKSFESSAKGIIRAGNLYHSNREMMGEELVDIVFEFPNHISGLEFEGEIPKSGSMMVTAEGDIALAISNGKYCVKKNYNSRDITITKDVKNCDLPSKKGSLASLATTSKELGVTSVNACAQKGQICEVRKTDPIAFAIKVNEEKTYKFYVLNDDGNTITLIMDRNLYGEGNTTEPDVAWINASDYTTENNKDETPNTCSYISCNDEGPITAINALNERTTDWDYITAKDYTYSGIGHDGTTRKYEDITRTMRARMLNYSEANTLGCIASSKSCPSWLYENLYSTGDTNTDGYWTSTARASYSNDAWSVNTNGYLYYSSVYRVSDNGVRPVIELSK